MQSFKRPPVLRTDLWLHSCIDPFCLTYYLRTTICLHPFDQEIIIRCTACLPAVPAAGSVFLLGAVAAGFPVFPAFVPAELLPPSALSFSFRPQGLSICW